MRLLIATSNPHKLGEIRAVLGQPGLTLLALTDLADIPPEPVEDGATFAANALLKAHYYADTTQLHCLADDSGLEVDALGGEPGVRSARYSNLSGPRHVVDPANNRLLLERLAKVPVPKRGARFICAMALAAPDVVKPLAEVRGVVEGRIIVPEAAADLAHPERGRGRNGFGYDPLFLIPSLGKTTAELDPEHKNAVSHRGQAVRLMAERMRALKLLSA